MRIVLTKREQNLLAAKAIPFDPNQDYSDDDALELLDLVREAEVSYSQGEDCTSRELYYQYARLGDKIYDLIPD